MPQSIPAFTGGSATCGLKDKDAQGFERAASYILQRVSSAAPGLQRKRLQVLHHLQTPQTGTLLPLSRTLLPHIDSLKPRTVSRYPQTETSSCPLERAARSSVLRRGYICVLVVSGTLSAPQFGYDLLALLLELQQLLSQPEAIKSSTARHIPSQPPRCSKVLKSKTCVFRLLSSKTHDYLTPHPLNDALFIFRPFNGSRPIEPTCLPAPSSFDILQDRCLS